MLSKRTPLPHMNSSQRTFVSYPVPFVNFDVIHINRIVELECKLFDSRFCYLFPNVVIDSGVFGYVVLLHEMKDTWLPMSLRCRVITRKHQLRICLGRTY